MSNRPSALASGLSAAFTYRRLAGVLWLGLLLSSLPAWVAFGPLFAPIDQSPFRESLLGGWDPWAVASFLGVFSRQIGVAFAAFGTCLVLSVLLDLLLVTGAVRVLLSGLPRPALRRAVIEGAALFRPVAWAFSRYVLTLVLWIGVLVAAPVFLLGKVAGEDAPPNGTLATLGFAWAVVGSFLVVASTNVRFSLARIALARGDASVARRAYRTAKATLRGGRAPAIGIWAAWFVAGVAIQAAFTALGVAMNPTGDAGVGALFVVRQAGFWLLAMTRVGYQASLLAFFDGRRPLPPLPLAHPVRGAGDAGDAAQVPVVPTATAEAGEEAATNAGPATS